MREQTVFVIVCQWDYEWFAADSVYETRKDAEKGLKKLQEEDRYGEYDYSIEEVPLYKAGEAE